MRATLYYGPRDVRVETVPDSQLQAPTDALVRITHACICGSDLWPYRGIGRWQAGWRLGHEWMGIVEEVGAEVRTVKRGDYVIAPFVFSDGTCEYCQKGLFTSCLHGNAWGGADVDGGQAEAIRAPYADGTLVVLPSDIAGDQDMLRSILPLTDVMGTGHHAAISAGVRAGGTVAVVGDGAVGLCGVLAARRLGAARIFIVGHQPARLALAQQFGATDVVTVRGKEAIQQIQDLTNGGVNSALECVGTEDALATAIGIVRPGGAVGYVGVPMEVKSLNIGRLFMNNIALRGGVAPVRAYLPELLADVLAGKLDPGPVLDLTVDLAGVPEAYAAMDARTAIKAMVCPS